MGIFLPWQGPSPGAFNVEAKPAARVVEDGKQEVNEDENSSAIPTRYPTVNKHSRLQHPWPGSFISGKKIGESLYDRCMRMKRKHPHAQDLQSVPLLNRCPIHCNTISKQKRQRPQCLITSYICGSLVVWPCESTFFFAWFVCCSCC